MRVFFKWRNGDATTEVLSPTNSDSDGLELAMIRTGSHVSVEAASPGRESLLVVLSGRCSVEADGLGRWEDLGDRRDVFSGSATAVYIPAGVRYRVSSREAAELGVIRAPAQAGGSPYVIQPRDVAVTPRGEGVWKRTVHTILDETRPAQSLVVGETFNEPGAWSSYPPHKHDVARPPREAQLQEVYHYRFSPQQGFGVQRIYSPDRGLDCAFVVENGDTVLIPFGYHPVAAAPGYRLYYLWALAGTGRRLQVWDDPAHVWVARKS